MAEENREPVEYAALLAENAALKAENTALRARAIDQDHEIFSLTFDEINRKDEQDALREENSALKTKNDAMKEVISDVKCGVQRSEYIKVQEENIALKAQIAEMERDKQEHSGSGAKPIDPREKNTLMLMTYAAIMLRNGTFPDKSLASRLSKIIQRELPGATLAENTIRNKIKEISSFISEKRL
ncbi:MAG: hypothetical protein PUB01_05960 [Desulfovibrionaceae bacterium]|nr:hypothetical protein [Desulfovibrionaceae bacterium]